MAPPSDVVQVSEALPIKDRSSWSGALVDESFGLGPYRVAEVDRKWNSTNSNSFFGYEASRTKGGYAFKLVDGAAKLDGECATEQREQSKKLGGGASFGRAVAKLGCRCSGAEGASTLTLDAATGQQYNGKITAPGVERQVTAITEREKGSESSDPLGYRVDGDAPLGAVELKSPGKVWISRSLAGGERAQLACLFAGLLLYQLPKDL
jgi:hypothetical protein